MIEAGAEYIGTREYEDAWSNGEHAGQVVVMLGNFASIISQLSKIPVSVAGTVSVAGSAVAFTGEIPSIVHAAVNWFKESRKPDWHQVNSATNVLVQAASLALQAADRFEKRKNGKAPDAYEYARDAVTVLNIGNTALQLVLMPTVKKAKTAWEARDGRTRAHRAETQLAAIRLQSTLSQEALVAARGESSARDSGWILGGESGYARRAESPTRIVTGTGTPPAWGPDAGAASLRSATAPSGLMRPAPEAVPVRVDSGGAVPALSR